MTEIEIKNTKEWFKDFIETYALSNQETIEFQKAVACLEEIQQYRAIGNIEEFKALKEKNEPKKIRRTYGTWSGDNYFKFPNNAVVFQCIECYSTVRVGENYCCNCGSCIDWSE